MLVNDKSDRTNKVDERQQGNINQTVKMLAQVASRSTEAPKHQTCLLGGLPPLHSLQCSAVSIRSKSATPTPPSKCAVRAIPHRSGLRQGSALAKRSPSVECGGTACGCILFRGTHLLRQAWGRIGNIGVFQLVFCHHPMHEGGGRIELACKTIPGDRGAWFRA